MSSLANIAVGALLAGASFGPSAWAEAAQVGGGLLHAASQFVAEEAGSPLTHAVAKARAALPNLPHGAH